MRNHAVHDIKNFGFTFAGYLQTNVSAGERNAWLRQISCTTEKLNQKEVDEIASTLRLMITISCISVCSYAHVRTGLDEANRKIIQKDQEIAELYRTLARSTPKGLPPLDPFPGQPQ